MHLQALRRHNLKHIVHSLPGHHQRIDIVIAVLAAAQDVEAYIQFGIGVANHLQRFRIMLQVTFFS